MEIGSSLYPKLAKTVANEVGAQPFFFITQLVDSIGSVYSYCLNLIVKRLPYLLGSIKSYFLLFKLIPPYNSHLFNYYYIKI